MASQGCAISSVRFAPASGADQRTGLLGFVTFTRGDLVLDGITVRRTCEGRLTLSFPARRGRCGEQHAYIRPLDDRARRDIERQILGAVDLGGGGAR